ncbi:MAG: DUF2726 domain-containing protein [Anaerolineales bacterium]|nr:DUF2726 domain-containing protein [Anaerolineales bacterium]
MKRFFQKLLEWLRMFFVILFEEDEDVKEHQRQEERLEQKQELEQKSKQATGIAQAVELGISSSDKPEYRKSKSVLTYRERILLRSIRRAVANEYTILMKVRMGDFVWLANEPKDRKFHNNQVQCKHVDFLICDKLMIEPLLVIELDDKSHQKFDHAERDKFKDETFEAVGLPIIRIEMQETYDADILKKQILEKIDNVT